MCQIEEGIFVKGERTGTKRLVHVDGARGMGRGGTYGMEHATEDFLRAMTTHIHRTQCDHSRRREDQEVEPVFLGLGLPTMGSLGVLE